MEREYYIEREVPRVTAERVETISNEMLNNPEVMGYLKTKIDDKLRFKETVASDDGTNNFLPWKRLGIFIVHEQKLPEQLVFILKRNGLDVYDDDVLELHIPPQEATSIKEVSKSFQRLREYLQANRRERSIPRYVYGVSYLAELAKHWGFTVVDLPKDIKEKSGAANILRNYADAAQGTTKAVIAKKYAVRDIKMCFISTDDLMEKPPEPE